MHVPALARALRLSLIIFASIYSNAFRGPYGLLYHLERELGVTGLLSIH